MRSWLEARVLPPEDPILLNILLPKAFEVLMDLNANRSLQDAALEAATQAIIVAEDTEKYHQLAVFCSAKVYLLHDAYVQAVTSEDAERPNIYCRIFTDLGESLLRDIIATPGRGLGDARTLDLILLCAQHYDYEVRFPVSAVESSLVYMGGSGPNVFVLLCRWRRSRSTSGISFLRNYTTAIIGSCKSSSNPMS